MSYKVYNSGFLHYAITNFTGELLPGYCSREISVPAQNDTTDAGSGADGETCIPVTLENSDGTLFVKGAKMYDGPMEDFLATQFEWADGFNPGAFELGEGGEIEQIQGIGYYFYITVAKSEY